jgi:hypothetical protein
VDHERVGDKFDPLVVEGDVCSVTGHVLSLAEWWGCPLGVDAGVEQRMACDAGVGPARLGPACVAC